MAVYSKNSPYYYTQILGRYLYYYTHVRVLPQPRDTQFYLSDYRYQHRPDNLAADLYGDPDLYWVFGLRNGWQDPLFDMKIGTWIITPDYQYVKTLRP